MYVFVEDCYLREHLLPLISPVYQLYHVFIQMAEVRSE